MRSSGKDSSLVLFNKMWDLCLDVITRFPGIVICVVAKPSYSVEQLSGLFFVIDNFSDGVLFLTFNQYRTWLWLRSIVRIVGCRFQVRN